MTFESGMLSIAVTAAPFEIRGKIIRQERPWGNWSRKLVPPKEIDFAKIAAQFENGVLTARVPKAAKVEPADRDRRSRQGESASEGAAVSFSRR